MTLLPIGLHVVREQMLPDAMCSELSGAPKHGTHLHNARISITAIHQSRHTPICFTLLSLFFDICRILAEKRPRAFFLENVKNLRSHDKGRTFQVIQSALDELDYELFAQVLDAQDYVPQHRERIVMIGFDRNRYGKRPQFDFVLNKPLRKACLADILESDVPDKYTLTDNLWAYLQAYAAKHRAAGNGFGYGFARFDGITRTLSARYYKDGSEILIPQESKNPRRLTPRECARLQGFPDSFEIPVSDTQAYRQFGNSVAVPLMSEVGKALVAELRRLDKGEH